MKKIIILIILFITMIVIKSQSSEEENYQKVLKDFHEKSNEYAVDILNAAFSKDIKHKTCVVMVENTTQCNIVVLISNDQGQEWKIPVPREGSQSIPISKGIYNVSSTICGVEYRRQKKIVDNTLIKLKLNY